MSESLVTCTIPLDTPGKHLGQLEIPRSTDSAGWSRYPIPLAAIGRGDGPTAVLFGGNHGDEYEGVVTLMELARRLDVEQVPGRVVIVPMLNRPAVMTGTRLSPLDGVNMNRAFPGNPDGTITRMLAHFVATELIPRADLVVDIHSGGSSMHMLPSVNMHRLDAGPQMDRMLEAGKEWGAPYVFLYRDVAGQGLLPSYAESLGKVTLGTEMGSKAQFGAATLDLTMAGIRRVLDWSGATVQVGSRASEPECRVVEAGESDDYVMAPCSGIFAPAVELAQTVEVGDTLGRMHDPERPFDAPLPVVARTAGLVFARRSIPLTEMGDCLVTIVREIETQAS